MDTLDIKSASRPAIRSLVARNGKILQEVALSGGNVQHASLDQQDQVEAMLNGFSEEERQAFYKVYMEELNADAAALNQKAERIMAEVSKKNAQIDMIAKAICTVIAVTVFAYILYRIKS